MKDIKLKNGQILKISSATLEDAVAFANYMNTIRYESKFLSMDDTEDSITAESELKWIENVLKNDNKFILVAKIDNVLVGMCDISPISNKVRYKHRSRVGVSVLKEFWGLGIASELMKCIIEKAKTVNFEQMELQVVDTNESAIHLYSKFGFCETGYIKNAIKYTDGSYANLILMQKDLTYQDNCNL